MVREAGGDSHRGERAVCAERVTTRPVVFKLWYRGPSGKAKWKDKCEIRI